MFLCVDAAGARVGVRRHGDQAAGFCGYFLHLMCRIDLFIQRVCISVYSLSLTDVLCVWDSFTPQVALESPARSGHCSPPLAPRWQCRPLASLPLHTQRPRTGCSRDPAEDRLVCVGVLPLRILGCVFPGLWDPGRSPHALSPRNQTVKRGVGLLYWHI